MNTNTQHPHIPSCSPARLDECNMSDASNLAPIPTIMCGIRDETTAPVLQLSPSLVPPGEGAVLYYPGSGTDHGPLVHFAQTTRLKAVVYVDYLVKVADIKTMLRGACLRLGIPEPDRYAVLRASQLGADDWSHFWHPSPRSQWCAGPDKGTGFQCELALPDGPVKFVFLRTEGHQTYSNLLHTALQPDIVVLQDHGFGCNWRDFGHASPMFISARRQGCLPLHLFVAEGTQAWTGYQRTEPYDYQEGQMHRFGRALFVRTPSRDDLDDNDCFESRGGWYE